MPAGKKTNKSGAKPSLRDKMAAAYGEMKSKSGKCCDKCGKKGMSCGCAKA